MKFEEHFFEILNQKNSNSLEIKQNINGAKSEIIQVTKQNSTKSENGKPAVLLETTQGRQFARLDEWPSNLLIEVV